MVIDIVCPHCGSTNIEAFEDRIDHFQCARCQQEFNELANLQGQFAKLIENQERDRAEKTRFRTIFLGINIALVVVVGGWAAYYFMDSEAEAEADQNSQHLVDSGEPSSTSPAPEAGTIETSAPRSQQVASQIVASNAPAQNNPVRPPDINTRNWKPADPWLCRRRTKGYTAQLGSFESFAAMDRYVDKHPKLKKRKLHYFSARADSQFPHYLLYGSYSSRASVEKAVQKINANNAWIRAIKPIKNARCEP